MVELNIDLPPDILAKIGRFVSHPLADIIRQNKEDVQTRIEDMLLETLRYMGPSPDPSDRPRMLLSASMDEDLYGEDANYVKCFFYVKWIEDWEQQMEDEYARVN